MDLSSIQAWGRHQLFHAETAGRPWWQRLALFVARLVYAVGRDAARGQLTLRAMSLVYTTLLSLVPLLAVSFSVLKAFGVHNQIEPVLARMLAPLGAKGAEVTARIVEFVENIRVGVLGALGVVLLLYTVIALMQKIEQAFNEIWRVHRLRSFAQRFSDYLSVLLIGPVLVFSALGVTASVFSSETVRSLSELAPFGALLEAASRLLPYLLIIAAFTFAYLFVPNTRVRPLSALVGAFVGGVLWQSTGWVFASFVAGSAQYTAIYSAFATLIMFMIWLYLSWLILLIGATVAYYHQHPRRLVALDDDTRLSPHLIERLTLSVMTLVARAYYERRPPLTLDELAERLNLPADSVMEAVNALTGRGLLCQIEDDDGAGDGGLLPATPLEETPVWEVLEAARHHRERSDLDSVHLDAPPAAVRLLDDMNDRIAEHLAGRTVRDLVHEEPAPPARKPEAVR